jgi:hypothetical protein
MFGLFLHGEDINMVKGHNVGFIFVDTQNWQKPTQARQAG